MLFPPLHDSNCKFMTTCYNKGFLKHIKMYEIKDVYTFCNSSMKTKWNRFNSCTWSKTCNLINSLRAIQYFVKHLKRKEQCNVRDCEAYSSVYCFSSERWCFSGPLSRVRFFLNDFTLLTVSVTIETSTSLLHLPVFDCKFTGNMLFVSTEDVELILNPD